MFLYSNLRNFTGIWETHYTWNESFLNHFSNYPFVQINAPLNLQNILIQNLNLYTSLTLLLSQIYTLLRHDNALCVDDFNPFILSNNYTDTYKVHQVPLLKSIFSWNFKQFWNHVFTLKNVSEYFKFFQFHVFYTQLIFFLKGKNFLCTEKKISLKWKSFSYTGNFFEQNSIFANEIISKISFVYLKI